MKRPAPDVFKRSPGVAAVLMLFVAIIVGVIVGQFWIGFIAGVIGAWFVYLILSSDKKSDRRRS